MSGPSPAPSGASDTAKLGAAAPAKPLVDLFEGVGYEVAEIALCHRRLAPHVSAMEAALLARQSDVLMKAAEDIAKIAGELSLLSTHLASVLKRHAGK